MKCKIEGCDKECMYQKDQVCQKHYFRFMRYGTYELTKKPRNLKRTHSAGYICLFMPNHKLANSIGEVYEHRKVMYDKYGDNLPDCEICGAKTSWHPYKTHIDHINRIKSDNSECNLRVLCNPCNSRRDVNVLDRKGVTVFTVGTVSKTAFEWAKTDGVFVSGNTILRRKKTGLSDYDCIYMEKKTHKSKCKALTHPTTSP